MKSAVVRRSPHSDLILILTSLHKERGNVNITIEQLICIWKRICRNIFNENKEMHIRFYRSKP